MIGSPEKATQKRVIDLFTQELGYLYAGNWQKRPEIYKDNSNIEEVMLEDFFIKSGYNPAQITKAIHALQAEASNLQRDLYDNNQAVNKLLRYGVQVKESAGKPTETVQLINWDSPLRKMILPSPRR